MKSILALLPLAALVLAGPKEDEGPGILVHDGEGIRYEVHCETSEASPYIHHIHEAREKIDTEDYNQCRKKNPNGSRCSTLEESVGGSIAMCGPDKASWDILCTEVKEMAGMVADNCGGSGPAEGRAGGYVYREKRTFTSFGERWPPAWVEVSRNEG